MANPAKEKPQHETSSVSGIRMIPRTANSAVWGGRAMFVLISIKNGINNDGGGGTSIVISPRLRPY